jgi:hypothetical protein
MARIKSLSVAAILVAAFVAPSYAQGSGVARPHRTLHQRRLGRSIPRSVYDSYAGPYTDYYMRHSDRSFSGGGGSFLHPSDIRPSGS